MFLATAPAMRFAQAVWRSGRACVTAFGHAAAYVAGAVWGVRLARRYPVSGDVDLYEQQKRG